MLDQTIGDRWKALGAEQRALEDSIAARLRDVRSTIEPRATELASEIDVIEGLHGEIRECEACSKADTLEAGYHGQDGWFCSACMAEFQAIYDACDHDFVEGVCTKCTGLDPESEEAA